MTQPLTQTIGRRKTSVARVRLYEGTGQFTLNGKSLDEFFPTQARRLRVLEPLKVVDLDGKYDRDDVTLYLSMCCEQWPAVTEIEAIWQMR